MAPKEVDRSGGTAVSTPEVGRGKKARKANRPHKGIASFGVGEGGPTQIKPHENCTMSVGTPPTKKLPRRTKS